MYGTKTINHEKRKMIMRLIKKKLQHTIVKTTQTYSGRFM